MQSQIDKHLLAANEYSMIGQKTLAGLSYSLAADIYREQKQKQPAITNYIKAIKCYYKVDNTNAILVLNKLIGCLSGKPKVLGKYQRILGKFNFLEGRTIEALDAFKKASHYHYICNDIQGAMLSINDILNLLLKENDDQKALVYLESIHQKYQLKETFFQLGLLKLCLKGTKDCNRFLINNHDYMLYHGYFFLNDLIIAIETHEQNKFYQLIADYHSIHPLKTWQLKLLNQIKC